MIASITLTYGDQRTEIYEYKSKDELDKLFRNQFDLNLYIFHNSSDAFFKKITNSNLLSEFNFSFEQATGSWPSVFRQTLLSLKEKGVKRFIYTEDDVFTVTKNKNLILELANFLKQANINNLNLEYCSTDFPEKILNHKIIESKENFNVYDTDTFFFKSIPLWSFDHSPYFCDLDFAINEIYPQAITKHNDIWQAEASIKNKYDQINIPRYITDQKLFRRVHIVGKNNWDRENEINFLENLF